MENPCILVVDDEEGIRRLITSFLKKYHYQVIEADCGEALFAQLSQHSVDLIILDLMLPDIHGIDACKKIREHHDMPIIMLTAMQGEMSTVLGFEAGADDYIEKPFSAQVLLSRIRAILKRTQLNTEETPITQTEGASNALSKSARPYEKALFQHWSFQPAEPAITHTTGKTIFLTRNEHTLLKLFLENPESILTRERIATELNLDFCDTESRAIDVQISRLRNKLKDKSQNNLIRSIRNKGYLLTAPVKFIAVN